jgi:hypothetical protein
MKQILAYAKDHTSVAVLSNLNISTWISCMSKYVYIIKNKMTQAEGT